MKQDLGMVGYCLLTDHEIVLEQLTNCVLIKILIQKLSTLQTYTIMNSIIPKTNKNIL